jgi:hypothetical protein
VTFSDYRQGAHRGARRSSSSFVLCNGTGIMKSDLDFVHVLCSRGGTRRVRRPSCISCCTASFITESIGAVVEAVSDVRRRALGVPLGMCRVAPGVV